MKLNIFDWIGNLNKIGVTKTMVIDGEYLALHPLENIARYPLIQQEK